MFWPNGFRSKMAKVELFSMADVGGGWEATEEGPLPRQG